MKFLARYGIDTYMLLLILTVCLGAVLPVSGVAADVLSTITYCAVALLFFLYGVRLNSSEVIEGMTNWRLQGASFAATFVFLPVLGILIATILSPVLGEPLTIGILFLSILPSTINSSIAFTGMAGGNVSGAICSASMSNLIGVVLTPALAALVLHQGGVSISADAVVKIATQILLPFVLGQILRRWLAPFVLRHKPLTLFVDRGSILLIVYSAFSAGTVAGIWGAIPPLTLVILFAVILGYLVITMRGVILLGRLTLRNERDRAALFFCGSTKSLASGLPIALALFPAEMVSTTVLPLMMYHLTQLFICAVISQRMAARSRAA
ncbi:bile acid:sodium symporter family protein [Falsirhodobacter algicola]|uniref:Bile acid:sodium symporter n=1 Tax=Falsirhodobacter algicola TaxID=2692330 RepID=A0A8J8MRR7_9RHOB|nr:bile acid:sodium symporter family protein [Falsirhodobacter algicola]QUS35491.1 bile acid:sodium symporter [Falsirhodobacter algicola]